MSLSGRWGLGTYQGDAPLEIMNRILQELQLAQWVERLKVVYMKAYERLLEAGPSFSSGRQQLLPGINLYPRPVPGDILPRPRFRPGPYT